VLREQRCEFEEKKNALRSRETLSREVDISWDKRD
jgi:hypothetical protein